MVDKETEKKVKSLRKHVQEFSKKHYTGLIMIKTEVQKFDYVSTNMKQIMKQVVQDELFVEGKVYTNKIGLPEDKDSLESQRLNFIILEDSQLLMSPSFSRIKAMVDMADNYGNLMIYIYALEPIRGIVDMKPLIARSLVNFEV